MSSDPFQFVDLASNFPPSRIIAQGREVKSVENFLLYLSKLVKFNSTYSVYFYPSILLSFVIFA